jgi:acyl-CoA thioester hydrolase
MRLHHEIAIRYGEVDLQRVVFNAHYLAYIDDAMDHWMRELDADFESLGWDFMLKRAELEWQGSAGLNDVLSIDGAVARWGTTSFDVSFQLTVGGQPVASALITYVGIAAGTATPTPPPVRVRRHLGGSDEDHG